MRIVVAATYTPAPGLWGYDVRSNEMSDDKTSPAIDLPADERAAIDHYHALRQDATHYDLLGLPVDADRRAVRDAYFALSKRFHPDVYFKREIGAYHEKIEGIFRALTRAYDALSNPRQRAAYDKLLSDEGVTSSPRPSQAFSQCAAACSYCRSFCAALAFSMWSVTCCILRSCVTASMRASSVASSF